jgi:hypothetical protein
LAHIIHVLFNQWRCNIIELLPVWVFRKPYNATKKIRKISNPVHQIQVLMIKKDIVEGGELLTTFTRCEN